MRKKSYVKVESPNLSVFNNDTGEVVSGVVENVAIDIDSFIMVFLNSISSLYKLDGMEIKILMHCWKKSMYSVDYSGNIIVNDVEFKNGIVSSGLGVSVSTVDVYISKLCKKEMLIRVSRGKYMLNPRYFWKGVITDRSKLLFKLQYNGAKV